MKDKEKNKRSLARRLKHAVIYVATQRTVVILALVAQIVLICYMFLALQRYSTKMVIIFQVIAGITAVHVLNTSKKAEFKLGWLVPMVIFPIFTVAIYFYLSNQYGARVVRNRFAKKAAETQQFLKQDKEVISKLKAEDGEVYRYACYMNNYAGFPVWQDTSVKFFPSGEEKLGTLKRELEKAKYYIFIEMFIVDRGTLWDELFEILRRKAEEGLDIRFIYDGMGSQHLLPFGYHRKLTELGIKTRVFQPFLPMLSSIQNNRDHRKIIVIDGHTGFTGGDNIADEYVNRIERFGYWKDTSVMLKGKAVWNLTMMFLQMWEVTDPKGKAGSYELYLPDKYTDDPDVTPREGFVLPFGDCPLDGEDVGAVSYMHILTTATEYCYISTPYLILNEELLGALCYAAKRGVDVRVIVPGIPDKWYVKVMGESFFTQLKRAGVRIYEYNGFNHAKMFVSDDRKAIVGTINLDYRSLYLHFENGCYMYGVPAIADIRRDFEDMFANSTRELSLENCEQRPLGRRMVSALLKTLEPLL